MTELEGVVPALGQALTGRGYTTLTPVQEAVLVEDNREADLLVSAQTGSGKTVAFGLTIAPALLQGEDRFAHVPAPLALVVAPTRELALQVRRELEWLYAQTGAVVASCVGGMDMRAERQVLARGAHIVVGTPGRLRDHIERHSLDTSAFRAVILDEADEMLDMGFREDLEFILKSAPEDRRTLMFSATVPRSIAALAKRYQRNAIRVTTSAEQKQHVDIDYRAILVAPSDRENAIINVLRYYDATNALVFCGTRAGVNRMISRFSNRGFSVVALSGELSQNERSHALQALRDGRARVCIATDVAARGLDLPNLDLVVHADLPQNSDVLLHRSGRTGRAGRKGVSVLVVPHSARKKSERLLQGANIKATWDKPPTADQILARDDERLLDDPSFAEPATDTETAFARKLIARHGAEQVAAAFVRRARAGQSAPEDLMDDAGPTQKRRPREDFRESVWFSLSVGHRESAEARWLLPMLCRAGQLTKGEIGAIKVYHAETHVELVPECAERFLKSIGPDRIVEKGVTVTPLDGQPKEPGAEPRAQPYSKRKRLPDAGAGERRGPDRPPKARKERYIAKADRKPAPAPAADAGWEVSADTAPRAAPEPRETRDSRPLKVRAKQGAKGKKTRKANGGKPRARGAEPTLPGTAPRKRKDFRKKY